MQTRNTKCKTKYMRGSVQNKMKQKDPKNENSGCHLKTGFFFFFKIEIQLQNHGFPFIELMQTKLEKRTIIYWAGIRT